MDIKNRRKQENKDIIARMRRGEPLQRSPEGSFFPPRKKIKKDEKLMAKLYGIKKP